MQTQARSWHTWDQQIAVNARFSSQIRACAATFHRGADSLALFGAEPLPAYGTHTWGICFDGRLDQSRSLGNTAFVGVSEQKWSDPRRVNKRVNLSKNDGVYGLRDDSDDDALRVNGNAKGWNDTGGFWAKAGGTRYKSFALRDTVILTAFMDRRPRELMFEIRRKKGIERVGVVKGFGATVYIAAGVCTIVAKFKKGIDIEIVK